MAERYDREAEGAEEASIPSVSASPDSADLVVLGRDENAVPEVVGKRQARHFPSAGLELLAVAVLFGVVSLAAWLTQPPISLQGGTGWDGLHYFNAANLFAEGNLTVQGEAPYVFRIGTSILASLLPGTDMIANFRWVNVAGNLLLVLLFAAWLRQYIGRWQLRALLNLLFVTNWVAPVRFVFFYPVWTDTWFMLCMLGGLIAIHRMGKRIDWLLTATVAALSFAGVIFRESGFILPLALLGRNILDFNWKRLGADLIPLLAAGAGYWLTHAIATASNEYPIADITVGWAYDKPLAFYVHGWFIAFGPVLVVLLFLWRDAAAFLGRYKFQAAYLLLAAALGWLGGTDTERLLMWGAPVVYVLLGVVIERNLPLLASVPLLAVLTVTQFVTQRIIWVLPDYPNAYPHTTMLLTPVGNEFPYLDVYSLHSPREITRNSLVQYLALAALLLLWLGYRRWSLERGGKRLHIGVQAAFWIAVIPSMALGWYTLNREYIEPRVMLTEQARWDLGLAVSGSRGIDFIDDQVYIANYDAGTVVRFDPSAEAAQPFTPTVPLGHPGDVKEGPDGLIYVLDNDNPVPPLRVLQPDGQWVEDIQLQDKSDIAIGLDFDSRDNMYVADMRGGTILKYRPDGGAPADAMQPPGRGFNNVAGLLVNDPFVYAAEPSAKKVHQFGLDGRYMRSFDLKCGPLYMAVSGDWLAVTCDSRIVFVNTQTGEQRPAVYPDPPGPLMGITYGPDGRLYVMSGLSLVAYDVSR